MPDARQNNAAAFAFCGQGYDSSARLFSINTASIDERNARHYFTLRRREKGCQPPPGQSIRRSADMPAAGLRHTAAGYRRRRPSFGRAVSARQRINVRARFGAFSDGVTACRDAQHSNRARGRAASLGRRDDNSRSSLAGSAYFCYIAC